MLIFEYSRPQRQATSQMLKAVAVKDIPHQYMRTKEPMLPAVSELQVVRHYTKLSRKNYSIDTQFYPLGSCSMKYNPRGAHRLAMLPEFLNRHPYTSVKYSQGYLQCAYEVQEMIKNITGMAAVSLTPLTGAQGEFAGVAMIRAYHEAQGDKQRDEILVPDAAHGTNPASAAMCGYKVREIPTGKDGDLDLDALKAALGHRTAGIMLTNPSTLGVFERRIKEMADMVHAAGGLLYYDGANLNAILGKVRPADMGFDVIHINLHKTFATPHGGGGPGSGPVAVNAKLSPFLPVPMVGKKDDQYIWLTEKDCPQTIGRLSGFMGSAGVILRAYVYMRMLGQQGMHRVGEFATLNANYLLARLRKLGFNLAYSGRRASHEFLLTLTKQKKELNVSALDFAKRLLDYDFHAPTVYFPLLVPECMMIEPTETESKQMLDQFADAMASILQEAKTDPEKLYQAPQKMPVRRLDEVKAARDLDIVWKQKDKM